MAEAKATVTRTVTLELSKLPFPELLDNLLLDPENEHLRSKVTRFDSDGYARIGARSLHHYILPNLGQESPVDHKNRNKLDNRKENLHYTTRRGNALNAKLRKDNTTGLRGVHWNSVNKRWAALARVKGTLTQLYGGQDFFEACCARKSWEVRHGN